MGLTLLLALLPGSRAVAQADPSDPPGTDDAGPAVDAGLAVDAGPAVEDAPGDVEDKGKAVHDTAGGLLDAGTDGGGAGPTEDTQQGAQGIFGGAGSAIDGGAGVEAGANPAGAEADGAPSRSGNPSGGPSTASGPVPKAAPKAAPKAGSAGHGDPRAAEGGPEISVKKTNDADGDGSFSQDEVAPKAGLDVPFHLEITNLGDVPVVIQQIVDTYRVESVNVCGELMGAEIEPGGSRTCTFDLRGYTPPLNESIANRISVVAIGNPSGSTSAQDISTVTTAKAEVAGALARPPATNQPLASTGSDLLGLFLVTLLLAGNGAGALLEGRRRERSEGRAERQASR